MTPNFKFEKGQLVQTRGAEKYSQLSAPRIVRVKSTHPFYLLRFRDKSEGWWEEHELQNAEDSLTTLVRRRCDQTRT